MRHPAVRCLAVAIVVVCVVAAFCPPAALAQALSATALTNGQVLVGVGGQPNNGEAFVDQFVNGTLVGQLNTQAVANQPAGFCQGGGSLFVPTFEGNAIAQFNSSGALVNAAFGGMLTDTTGLIPQNPESCAVLQTQIACTNGPTFPQGSVFVGTVNTTAQLGGTLQIISPTGTVLAKFSPTPEMSGVDFIAIVGQTVLFTSEGTTIQQFNVCTGQQSTFAAGLPGPCYQIIVRPDGTIAVACQQAIVLLSACGRVIATIPATACFPLGTDSFFAIALQLNGSDIFALGLQSGNIYSIGGLGSTSPSCTLVFNTLTAPTSSGGPNPTAPPPFGFTGILVVGTPAPNQTAPNCNVTPVSTPGKVTAGGYVDPVTLDLTDPAIFELQNAPDPTNNKVTFGFVVQYTAGAAAPKGQFRLIDHATGEDVKSTAFVSLVISPSTVCGLLGGQHATFDFFARESGVPGQEFQVDVDDCGEPGSQPPPPPPDMFKIQKLPAGYTAMGPLIGGNIQVHAA